MSLRNQIPHARPRLDPGIDPRIQGRFATAKPHWVCMLASQRNGTLYIGVTRDLPKRMFEHRNGLTGGFTTQYGVHRLVFAEPHETTVAAILREKNIKHRPRKWKLALIERDDPQWEDLYDRIV